MDDRERESLAVHEAGHAVISDRLTMSCGRVTIVRDNDSEGHALIADPYRIHWDWDQRGKFRDFRSVMIGQILAVIAGTEAEQEILGAVHGGDEDDRHEIALMLDSEGMGEREGRLRRACRMLVRRHRQSIETVARALIEKRIADRFRSIENDLWVEAYSNPRNRLET